jgi:excisionase family DNA binding protein
MTNDHTDVGSGSPWMSPAAAAGYLGIAIGTLRNWTSARYVPFARRGRVVRYHRDALDSWLRSGACPGRTTYHDSKAVRGGGTRP